MTQLWIDSEQYKKAIDYWEGLLKDKPNDPEIMGTLAGINLKAGDWRKSIEWYLKVAEVANDAEQQGRAPTSSSATWPGPSSTRKTLIGARRDRARRPRHRRAAAGGRARSPRTRSWSACRHRSSTSASTAHGASWAAAIDRASAQDLIEALARSHRRGEEGPGTTARNDPSTCHHAPDAPAQAPRLPGAQAAPHARAAPAAEQPRRDRGASAGSGTRRRRQPTSSRRPDSHPERPTPGDRVGSHPRSP